MLASKDMERQDVSEDSRFEVAGGLQYHRREGDSGELSGRQTSDSRAVGEPVTKSMPNHTSDPQGSPTKPHQRKDLESEPSRRRALSEASSSALSTQNESPHQRQHSLEYGGLSSPVNSLAPLRGSISEATTLGPNHGSTVVASRKSLELEQLQDIERYPIAQVSVGSTVPWPASTSSEKMSDFNCKSPPLLGDGSDGPQAFFQPPRHLKQLCTPSGSGQLLPLLRPLASVLLEHQETNSARQSSTTRQSALEEARQVNVVPVGATIPPPPPDPVQPEEFRIAATDFPLVGRYAASPVGRKLERPIAGLSIERPPIERSLPLESSAGWFQQASSRSHGDSGARPASPTVCQDVRSSSTKTGDVAATANGGAQYRRGIVHLRSEKNRTPITPRRALSPTVADTQSRSSNNYPRPLFPVSPSFALPQSLAPSFALPHSLAPGSPAQLSANHGKPDVTTALNGALTGSFTPTNGAPLLGAVDTGSNNFDDAVGVDPSLAGATLGGGTKDWALAAAAAAATAAYNQYLPFLLAQRRQQHEDLLLQQQRYIGSLMMLLSGNGSSAAPDNAATLQLPNYSSRAASHALHSNIGGNAYDTTQNPLAALVADFAALARSRGESTPEGSFASASNLTDSKVTDRGNQVRYNSEGRPSWLPAPQESFGGRDLPAGLESLSGLDPFLGRPTRNHYGDGIVNGCPAAASAPTVRHSNSPPIKPNGWLETLEETGRQFPDSSPPTSVSQVAEIRSPATVHPDGFGRHPQQAAMRDTKDQPSLGASTWLNSTVKASNAQIASTPSPPAHPPAEDRFGDNWNPRSGAGASCQQIAPELAAASTAAGAGNVDFSFPLDAYQHLIILAQQQQLLPPEERYLRALRLLGVQRPVSITGGDDRVTSLGDSRASGAALETQGLIDTNHRGDIRQIASTDPISAPCVRVGNYGAPASTGSPRSSCSPVRPDPNSPRASEAPTFSVDATDFAGSNRSGGGLTSASPAALRMPFSGRRLTAISSLRSGCVATPPPSPKAATCLSASTPSSASSSAASFLNGVGKCPGTPAALGVDIGESTIATQFFRTKMCPWFPERRCRMGDRCNWAHSDAELRPSVDLTNTKLCENLFKRGRCDKPRCRFAHSREDLRATTDVYKTSVCVFWERGGCAAGARCRYAHGEQELRRKMDTSVASAVLTLSDVVSTESSGPKLESSGGVSLTDGRGCTNVSPPKVSRRGGIGPSRGASVGVPLVPGVSLMSDFVVGKKQQQTQPNQFVDEMLFPQELFYSVAPVPRSSRDPSASDSLRPRGEAGVADGGGSHRKGSHSDLSEGAEALQSLTSANAPAEDFQHGLNLLQSPSWLAAAARPKIAPPTSAGLPRDAAASDSGDGQNSFIAADAAAAFQESRPLNGDFTALLLELRHYQKQTENQQRQLLFALQRQQQDQQSPDHYRRLGGDATRGASARAMGTTWCGGLDCDESGPVSISSSRAPGLYHSRARLQSVLPSIPSSTSLPADNAAAAAALFHAAAYPQQDH